MGPTWAQTNIRGQPHLDGLGALGDIGWYCTRVILWAFDFDMPSAVTAHRGTRFADSGVVTSCGATYEWKDGRIGTFRCSFYGDMIMKAVCSGSKGSLEVDDFVIPMKEDHSMFVAKRDSEVADRSTGWTSHKKTHEVRSGLTQEGLMVQQFARLVGQIIDGSGRPDAYWPAISKKTQILLNAVKSESNSTTITL